MASTIIVSSLIASPVLAYDEQFYSGNDILFYDPTAEPCSTNQTANIQITGKDSADKAWNYLTGKGLSKDQAAGIIGNLLAESGLSPKADNGSFVGIAQWNKGGRWAALVKWAKQNNKDENSFETQLEYVWKEGTDRGNIDGIKKYSDVPHTAWYWGRYFEVAIINGSKSETPLTNVQSLDARTKFAQKIFSQHGGVSSTGTSGSTTSDPSQPCGTTTASCSNVNSTPPDDFAKVQYQGHTFDKRTLFMIHTAEDCAKQLGIPSITVLQGSYNPGGVAASGTSHAKGGALDVSINGLSQKKIDDIVTAFRQTGFAAWYRDASDGFAGNEHIHAVALGAPSSGPAALGSPGQIISYCSGGDGLSIGGKDRHLKTIGRPIPTWAEKDCKRYP